MTQANRNGSVRCIDHQDILLNMYSRSTIEGARMLYAWCRATHGVDTVALEHTVQATFDETAALVQSQ